MSMTSLPSYVRNSLSRIPSYSAEPQAYEQRLAWSGRNASSRPTAEFVKQSKSGGISLRLRDQEQNATLPVYGCGAIISGTIDLTKIDTVIGVEVKIEGSLHLKEIAEGGTTSHKLCLSRLTLWSRDRPSGTCPSSLPFSLSLPATFSDGKDAYSLPPTHEVHLSGVPGFRATIDYSVTANVQKAKSTSLLPIKNNNVVSTPFIYFPRSRPAVPLPSPLTTVRRSPGVTETPDWRCFESTMTAKTRRNQDITSKLYIPTSRVFCMREPIPFHLTFASSGQSLTAFLPYAPSTTSLSPRRPTRIQMLRQSSVDVRNPLVLDGTKTDIWSVVSIGEGTFRHCGDGADFMSFAGEIRINDDVRLSGFRAGGLFIKDCIVLSVHPPEPAKCPFTELRIVVPVRLTTDSWSTEGGVLLAGSEYSIPSSPSPEEGQVGHQRFGEYREGTPS